MFEFLKYPTQISDLTTQKAMLESDLAFAHKRIEELKAKIESPKENTTLQSCSIDFSKMDVFSIERNQDKSECKPCTIIGHFMTVEDGVKKTAEWYLYCSIEKHEKLVKEFNEFKLKGTNGTK